MKIISWNVNGLRAIWPRNFSGWLKDTQPDILCLQEIKAQPEHIPVELTQSKDYHLYLNSAQKKGYAGVAVYSKIKPQKVNNIIGLERFDSEGRFLELHFPGFILINLYLPHGGRQKENMGYKLEVYDWLLKYLKKFLRRSGRSPDLRRYVGASGKNRNIILIGDFNIAHTELDLARPKDNINNTMFTPQERQQLDKLESLRFIDTFRKMHQRGGYYTWWPYWGNARQRNLGWRLDYIFISKSLSSQLKKAFILTDIPGSDHCPMGIEL